MSGPGPGEERICCCTKPAPEVARSRHGCGHDRSTVGLETGKCRFGRQPPSLAVVGARLKDIPFAIAPLKARYGRNYQHAVYKSLSDYPECIRRGRHIRLHVGRTPVRELRRKSAPDRNGKDRDEGKADRSGSDRACRHTGGHRLRCVGRWSDHRSGRRLEAPSRRAQPQVYERRI